MEIDGRDFLKTPSVKTVRFGGSVAETLEKHKHVSYILGLSFLENDKERYLFRVVDSGDTSTRWSTKLLNESRPTCWPVCGFC